MHIGRYNTNSVEITNITKKITVCTSEQYGLRYLSGSRIKVIFVTAISVMLFVCKCFAISVNRGNLNQRALLTVLCCHSLSVWMVLLLTWVKDYDRTIQ